MKNVAKLRGALIDGVCAMERYIGACIGRLEESERRYATVGSAQIDIDGMAATDNDLLSLRAGKIGDSGGTGRGLPVLARWRARGKNVVPISRAS